MAIATLGQPYSKGADRNRDLARRQSVAFAPGAAVDLVALRATMRSVS
jgi:hypothetical protein